MGPDAVIKVFKGGGEGKMHLENEELAKFNHQLKFYPLLPFPILCCKEVI